MKIKCQYCGSMINDTLDHCPFCGGENPNVVRTANDTPTTIEELQEWYTRHGLPPYETTRFFIGQNYTEPRAFGIYKDDNTGNFIVYKNKNSGERAIRYQGTDEAYAVNELYMRLKQEIIEQKANNLKKNNNSNRINSGTYSENSSDNGSKKKKKSNLNTLIVIVVIMLIINAGLIAFVASWLSENDYPENGYYNYDEQYYYYFANAYDWFTTDDNGEWDNTPVAYGSVPEALDEVKTSKEYYLSSDWSSDLGCPNFDDTTFAKDWNSSPDIGYYQYGGNDYYNVNGSYNYGWYIYDNDNWEAVDSEDVPDELKHSDTYEDFYYTPTWDSSTQITDFEDSDAYAQYQEEQDEWDNSDDNSYDDDNDYDWSSSDSSDSSWDSGSSDFDSDW